MDQQSSGEPPPASSAPMHHTSVVLFYKYFLYSSGRDDDCTIFRSHASHYLPLLLDHQKQLCHSLNGMRGRILLSAEGVNGTLSAANARNMQQYIDTMKNFDLIRDLGPPPTTSTAEEGSTKIENADESTGLYANIDWKLSSVSPELASRSHIFPDLKISAVKEIVATGGQSIDDIPKYGGKHLSPEEFHEALLKEGKDLILIDVRNTFEYDIGHFVNPNLGGGNSEVATDETAPATTETPAINPEMTNFTQFDSQFCARNADEWKDKKVLMYCTGGIRCEKASTMMRKRGIDNVCQLSGGIHRYLEKYGDTGFFKGKNFTFDQRVAMDPKDCLIRNDNATTTETSDPTDTDTKGKSVTSIIVGKCLECSGPHDTISGSRVCTVCRDLVLVCPACTKNLRELHCARHSGWKQCYFTFLEIFSADQLAAQLEELKQLRDGLVPPAQHKSMRKTLNKQIDKVQKRIKALETGEAKVDKDAARRCRTCMETSDVCDGLCWGFWKQGREETKGDLDRKCVTEGNSNDVESGSKRQKVEDIKPIDIGDIVEPGEAWNELRLGPKTQAVNGTPRSGRVVELKSWGSMAEVKDCVAVIWNDEEKADGEALQPKIYRWGTMAVNGERMYDVRRCQNDSND